MSSDFSDHASEEQPEAASTPGDIPEAPPASMAAEGTSKRMSPAVGGMLPDKRETVISKPVAEVQVEPHAVPAELARTPQELGASLEGTMLGHFQLEQFVGGGGMGAVFRGVDTMLGRTVAVKVLSRDRTDPETLRRFKNEAQSAARLDNENIARVYFVGEDRGLHYIVFEFIEGINVRDLVEQEGSLSLADAISYTLQVAEALDHASQRNVVHRDIKPSNVLVAAGGRAKLVDMGLARLHQVETDSKDLTASGVTLGTFDYISPEQARDPRAADVRSDLYSLGCTFYFMLTGRPPFPEGTVLQKLLSHSGEDPTDPRMFRPALDDQVVRVLNKLLAKQPAQRYQEPRELIGELLRIVDRLNLSGVAPGGRVWRPPRPWFTRVERALPWLVPPLLLVASLVLLEFSWPDASGESVFGRRPELASPPVLEDPAEGTGSLPAPPSTPSAEPAPRPDGPPEAEPEGGAGLDPEAAVGTQAAPTAKGKEGPQPTLDISGRSAEEGAEDEAESPMDEPPPVENGLGDGPPREPAGAPRGVANREAGSGKGEPGLEFNRVVVSPEAIEAPPGALVVSNLDTACRLAASSMLSTIELRFDGVLEERPLEIASPSLSIRNAAGFEPTVAFRPNFEDLIGDRRMIRVAQGQLKWQGVDALLELPVQAAEGWDLFTLDNGASLEVEDSVLTIRNVDADGAILQRQVAFVTLLESPAVAIRGQVPAEPLPVPPRISFQRSLLRGQAAVLRAEQAMPFRLICRQSLVVSSQWLVDVSGARREPSVQEGPIDVVLNHVTAVLGKGLCRLSSTADAPYQQVLVTDGKDNIILLTGSDAALIERRGAVGPNPLEKRLFLRGRDNFYLNAAALLRINPGGDRAAYLDYDFEDREQPWYQEESPRFNVLWQGLPDPAWTEDRHTPLDYLLDNDSANPAMNAGKDAPAGVDTSQLPLIVDTGDARVP